MAKSLGIMVKEVRKQMRGVNDEAEVRDVQFGSSFSPSAATFRLPPTADRGLVIPTLQLNSDPSQVRTIRIYVVASLQPVKSDLRKFAVDLQLQSAF
jgi:hypothetical protein